MSSIRQNGVRPLITPFLKLNISHPLATGLVAYYASNQGGAGTWFDKAKSNKGTLTGGAVWGRDKGMVLTTSATDYVDCGNDASIHPAFPMTMVWYGSVTSLAAANIMMSTDSQTAAVANNYGGPEMDVTTTGTINISWGDNTSTGSTGRRSLIGSLAGVSANVPFIVVAIVRGATDMTLYINGVKDGSPTFSGTAGALVYLGQNLQLGRRTTGSVIGMAGEIYMAAVYNKDIGDFNARAISVNPFAILYDPTQERRRHINSVASGGTIYAPVRAMMGMGS